jgi:hypothetical protein
LSIARTRIALARSSASTDPPAKPSGYLTSADRVRELLRHRLAGLLISLLVFLAPAMPAQTSVDSVRQHDHGPTRAWLSLGLGAGSSDVGSLAVRGAASVAVNRVLFLTLEETAFGSPGADHSLASTNLLVGVQTSNPSQFVFLSAGLATTKCGSGCAGQSGLAVDGGLHIGARHAGMGLIGFVIRTPARTTSSVNTSASGVAISVDVGWFQR